MQLHNFGFQNRLFYVKVLDRICGQGRAVSNFYNTEIEIWAGFGPVGSTKTKWPSKSKRVFSCSHGQKKIEIRKF